MKPKGSLQFTQEPVYWTEIYTNNEICCKSFCCWTCIPKFIKIYGLWTKYADGHDDTTFPLHVYLNTTRVKDGQNIMHTEKWMDRSSVLAFKQQRFLQLSNEV